MGPTGRGRSFVAMRSPPEDLGPDELQAALVRGWELEAGSLVYVPEGGGGHHWRLDDRTGTTWFVTVDDLGEKAWLGTTRDAVFGGLGRALHTAARLRDEAGLTFVVAPVSGPAGRLLDRISDRYALSVLPFLAGRSHPFGPYLDAALREQALELIIALHQATPRIRDHAPGHVPGFGGRSDLEAFLAEPDRPWGAGPFSERAQGQVSPRARDLSRMLAAFDRLVELTAAARVHTVITHGEPHPANLISDDGCLFLIDWDTVALAPPERDLALILGPEDQDAARYTKVTGRAVDLRVTLLYRARWYLDDLGSAIRMFRRPHRVTADTRRWSEALAGQLEALPEWIRRIETAAQTYP